MDDFARAQIQALQRRVDDLEHNLRLVFEHTGLDTATLHRNAPPVDPQLVEMLRAGRMVQAIKVYADTHGVDLMTAKTAVEVIHAEGNY
jgi:hypothetical protein